MILWLDTEFNDFRGDLISIGLVDEQGREFYESVGCREPSEWVAEHVMPVISRPRRAKEHVQHLLQEWLKPYDEVHVIADWPEDIANFCNLLITGPGKRVKTPPLTMEVRRDLDSNESAIPHNALEDAKAIRRMHLALVGEQFSVTA